MLRIRKNMIKVVIEQEFGADGLNDAIESVKQQVDGGLDLLATVAPTYDEVRIDKDGNLHCKNLARVDDKPEGEDDNE